MKVPQFRARPLGEYRYLWLDAMYEKVREDGHVESMAVVLVTGTEGRREVLDFDIVAEEAKRAVAPS
jgi:transposase-like protein